jgi:hypothetical protein
MGRLDLKAWAGVISLTIAGGRDYTRRSRSGNLRSYDLSIQFARSVVDRDCPGSCLAAEIARNRELEET